MFNPSKKAIVILYTFTAFLILFFILSISLFSSSAKGKKHIQKIELLHQADISNIDIITIQNGNQNIILSKSDNSWLLINPQNDKNKIPADTDKLSQFFVMLCSTHDLIKAGKADIRELKENSLNSYGFDQNNGTTITLYKNSSPYQQLYFGSLNFSQSQRYFTTNELNSVFLAGPEFENFLSTSVQSWVDPYIISEQLRNSVFTMGEVQTVTFYDYINKKNYKLENSKDQDKEKINKLLELRHGGFAQIKQDLDSLNKEAGLSFEMGDKSNIYMELYLHPAEENEYIVNVTFNSERLSKSFSYTSQISLWTYNKIKEMML